MLISNGANEHINDTVPSTPFNNLCCNPKVTVELLQFLVSKGADPNLLDEMQKNALVTLAQNKNMKLELIEYLVDSGNNINHVDVKGVSVCHYIFSNPMFDLNIAKYLVSKGIDLNSRATGLHGGFTPIHKLCQRNKPDLELFKFLKQNGADFHIPNDQSRTPAYLLLKGHKLSREYLEFIVENCDVNNDKLLSAASQYRNPDFESIRFLVEHKGANVNHTENPNLRTPLHYLCKHSEINLEIIKFLIENGSDVNATDYLNLTPLHELVRFRPSVEIVSLFFERGYDLQKVKPKKVVELMNRALKNSHCSLEVLKMFVERGAPIQKMAESACLCRSELEVVKYFVMKEGKVQECFYAACKNQKITKEILAFLLERGADINYENNPFCALCEYGSPSQEIFITILSRSKLNLEKCEDSNEHPLTCLKRECPSLFPLLEEYERRGTVYNISRHVLFPEKTRKSIETLLHINKFRIQPYLRIPRLLLHQIFAISTIL